MNVAFILTVLLHSSVHLHMFVAILLSYPCLSYFIDSIFILYVVFISVLLYSLLVNFSFFLKYLYWFLNKINTYLYSKHKFDNANHEGHSMKSNKSLVNLMPHYDTRRQCVCYNFCYLNRKYTTCTSVFGV